MIRTKTPSHLLSRNPARRRIEMDQRRFAHDENVVRKSAAVHGGKGATDLVTIPDRHSITSFGSVPELS